MKYLSHNESEITNFKTFIDKYKKSGYISTIDTKRLNSSDLKMEYFNKISGGVDKCLKFFNKNDFTLLSDLMMDVYDEIPGIDRESVVNSFQISCDNSYSFSKFSLPVSYDINDKLITKWDRKQHHSLESKDNIIEEIISTTINNRDNSIKDLKSSIEKSGDNRDKFLGYQLRGLSDNPFTNIKLSPVLTFDIKLNDIYEDDDYQNIRATKIVISRKFETTSIDQLKRYSTMIGYSDVSIRVKSDDMINNFLRLEVLFTL